MNVAHIRNNRHVWSAVILAAVVVGAAMFIMTRQHDQQMREPAAEQGVLDLTNWDIEDDGIVTLMGEWEFYWSQLLSSGDFAGGSGPPGGQLVQVPNVWTDYDADGESYSGSGYATYRLKVKMQEKPRTLGLRIPDMSTSCRVMIDGSTVARCGVVADNEAGAVARYAPQTVSFEAASGEFEVIVQVSNYLYDRGGMWYAIELGTDKQVNRLRENEMALDFILLGVFAFMGLYHLVIYSLRPKEKVALFFAIGCLIGALRLFVVDDMFLLNLLPNASVELITGIIYFTYYGGIAVLTWYLRELYPEELSRTVSKAVAALSGLFLATIFVLPLGVYTHLIRYYHVLMLAIGAYLIGCLLLAIWRRRDGAGLQFFGVSVFVLSIIHDLFFNLFYISDVINHANTIQFLERQIVLFGLFVLVFVQAIVLARRFSKAFRTVERMSDKLLSLDRLKDEFLVNTTHELKTPLHGIINLSQSMLEGSGGPVNEAQRNSLSVVVSVARRLTKLIEDIMDFSKLKNNEIVLAKTNVSLQAVIQANMEIWFHYLANKKVELKADIPDDLPVVHADENRLLQILYNLIGNAVKFTDEGAIVVAARAEGNQVAVRISDTGIGIPEEKQRVVFQSFEQGGAAIAREYGGAGLGLSITKRLVELNGGTIEVESEVGVGSAFTFTLPISPEQEEQKEHNEHREQAAERLRQEKSPDNLTQPVPSSGTRKENHPYTILAVDDDVANLQVIRHVLAQESYHILMARNGEEALRLLDKQPRIDLVLMDVMMPGLSGYEATRLIRERYSISQLPILLATVKNEPEDMISGFDAGANDFLAKPFYAHELRARVRTLLALKKSVEEVVAAELDFLRAQIKPHFLYNALNTIVGICPRDPRKASLLLTELSHYLRGSFDFQSRQKFVRLRDEMELVQSYVAIEKARFEDRLEVVYDWDESVDGLLPPLSIQPLVENAIRHGVLKKVEGGTVVVRISRDEAGIRIAVEDDGTGIPAEKLHMDRLAEAGGVGLTNIDQRLRRLYGTGLVIESRVGHGTSVIVTIPADREERV